MPVKSIKALSQSWNMEETFSPSQDMTKYVCSGGRLLREQDFSGNMDNYWIKWV